ncbi:MAG: ATP phosphoribosyltransferase regulatory subunit, partial [Gammaproteobacteria bacterium]|nr:ATP phosphoribosyltransferase regulatory subunit [Gammaproteobacteria bacterium]
GTICGGGRYDGLVEHIGGKACPAVGFGLGVDRTVLLMQEVGALEEEKPLAYFILVGEAAKSKGLVLANDLRDFFPNRVVHTHLSDSPMKTQFKKANQSNAEYAVIIGDDEIQNGMVSIKNLTDGSQKSTSFDELINTFN